MESTECSCEECKNMCRRRPCWPTPKEVWALIDKGFGRRLMLDWLGEIQIVSPAIVGCEGRSAPFVPMGQCTFLTYGGLCELHSLGLKPFEGRMASCKPCASDLLREAAANSLHRAVAEAWNNSNGGRAVERWESANAADNTHIAEAAMW